MYDFCEKKLQNCKLMRNFASICKTNSSVVNEELKRLVVSDIFNKK